MDAAEFKSKALGTDKSSQVSVQANKSKQSICNSDHKVCILGAFKEAVFRDLTLASKHRIWELGAKNGGEIIRLAGLDDGLLVGETRGLFHLFRPCPI